MNLNTLLILSLSLIAFGACKDDDEVAKTPEELLIGTWETDAYSDDTGNLIVVPDSDCDSDDTITFAAEAVATFDYNDDTQCSGIADEPVEIGSYIATSDNLTLVFDGDAELFDYEVDENILTINYANDPLDIIRLTRL